MHQIPFKLSDQASYRRKFKSVTLFQMCGNYTNRSQIQWSEVPKRKLWGVHSKKWRSNGTSIILICIVISH